MNRTNRTMNRIVTLIVGVVFLAGGAGVILAYAWPVAASWWKVTAARDVEWLEAAIADTQLGQTTASWATFVVLAIIVLLIVLLIVSVARVGRGQTHVFTGTGSRDGMDGRIVIDTGFASDALQQTLGQRADIVSSRVSTATVRGNPMLHVSVTPRQGVSPRRVVEDVERMLSNLMILTGNDVPTYVSIHAGLRSKLARDHRQVL